MGKRGDAHSETLNNEEKSRLLREAVGEKQCEAAQVKLERNKVEGTRQRAGDVATGRQKFVQFEKKGLSALPTCGATVAGNAESTEDSDSGICCSRDTGVIEDAVERVSEVEFTMVDVL